MVLTTSRQCRRSGIFIVYFERISHFFKCFWPWTVKCLPGIISTKIIGQEISENLPIFMMLFFNLFQPSLAFQIEGSHLICIANQMTGFYMECKTGLKWVENQCLFHRMIYSWVWYFIQFTRISSKFLQFPLNVNISIKISIFFDILNFKIDI